MNARFYLVFAALSCLVSVAFGAFGAHALKAMVSPERLAVWHTGVLYQMTHSLGLFILVSASAYLAPVLQKWAARFLVAGIVIFSGSLYLLVITNTPALGAITPIGGVSFLVGWLLLALAALKKQA
ncbi:DUF423 domain-containing protein [Advenella sp. RU8]|uniref:DUF423 domain-containing protein n=1 Tax=Advenella sp. RU8 TaxID=3399575 RepID=UPI003AAE67CE